MYMELEDTFFAQALGLSIQTELHLNFTYGRQIPFSS